MISKPVSCDNKSRSCDLERTEVGATVAGPGGGRKVIRGQEGGERSRKTLDCCPKLLVKLVCKDNWSMM